MGLLRFFKRTVGIRSGEERSAAILFTSLFLQGAAIALLFTVAISLFLEELPVHELPVVFILTSIFLWLGGWWYAKMEHKLPQSKISYIIIALFTTGVLLLRYGLHLSESSVLLYGLLVFFYVAYLLYNLDFWGTTALHYDIRESKRLFSLISAGDVPAKFLGYILALLLVSQIGTQNLLFIAAGFYLISIVLVRPSIAKRDDTRLIDHNPHAGGLLYAFQANGLIRQLALISLFSTAAYILVSFILYGYIKHEFHDEVSLVTFVAGLLSAGYIIKMIVMLFLTGRLHRWLGVRNALLITPVILILLSIGAFMFSLSSQNLLALYFFGALAVLMDILRSAIHYPVMMASMQVLPVKIRMAGHTVIKGLMDPFAYLLIGVALFLAASGDNVIDFRFLGILLVAMLLGNVVTCIPVKRQYLSNISSGIRSRNLGSKTIELTETSLLNQALKLIEQGTEDEVIFLLRILDPNSPNRHQVIEKALQHPSVKVRKSVILSVQGQGDSEINAILKSALLSEKEPALIHDMLQMLVLEEGPDVLSGFIDHSDEHVQLASMGLLLKYPSHPKYLEAAQKIRGLVLSQDIENIIVGLRALGESERPGIVTLDQFFSHSSPEVVLEAIKTVGKTNDISVLPHLFPLISNSRYQPELIKSLAALGEPAVKPALEGAKTTKDDKLRQSLLTLLANHDSKLACEALHELAQEWPKDLAVILDHLVAHKHAHSLKGQVYSFIEKLHSRAESLFSLYQSLKDMKEYHLLAQSIYQEFIRYRRYLLQSIYLDQADERLKKTFTGLSASQKDVRASSLELLEQVCGKTAVARFIGLYEPMANNERVNLLKKANRYFEYSADQAVHELLYAQDPPYSTWLQSLALYTIHQEKQQRVVKIPKALREQDETIVQELIELLEVEEI